MMTGSSVRPRAAAHLAVRPLDVIICSTFVHPQDLIEVLGFQDLLHERTLLRRADTSICIAATFRQLRASAIGCACMLALARAICMCTAVCCWLPMLLAAAPGALGCAVVVTPCVVGWRAGAGR